MENIKWEDASAYKFTSPGKQSPEAVTTYEKFRFRTRFTKKTPNKPYYLPDISSRVGEMLNTPPFSVGPTVLWRQPLGTPPTKKKGMMPQPPRKRTKTRKIDKENLVPRLALF